MTEPSFEDRRLSFGSEASSYADVRPGYPPEAARWILDGAQLPVREVADVGAGTGAFTRLLVDHGLGVTAYEPDPGMLAELAVRVPDVLRTVAPAESLPLEDAAVDAVTVAQAWHWFDKAAAGREFVRVVRPGGVIGLLWNVRDDRVPWMGLMSDIVGSEASMRPSFAEIRAIHPDATLADLYDPNLMPSDLRAAHKQLDKAVDAVYTADGGKRAWANDSERVAFLFKRYAQLTSLLGGTD